MPEPRIYHGAQRFGDKVFIVGGTTTGYARHSFDTVLLHDISNNCCLILAPLPFAVCDMATVTWKDKIIITGGQDNSNRTLNTVVVYSITNRKSTILPPLRHEKTAMQ